MGSGVWFRGLLGFWLRPQTSGIWDCPTIKTKLIAVYRNAETPKPLNLRPNVMLRLLFKVHYLVKECKSLWKKLPT